MGTARSRTSRTRTGAARTPQPAPTRRRDDIARAETALTQAHDRLTRAEEERNDAQANVAGAETAVAARLAWDSTHGWRIERTAEIDHTLAHHWADVTLRAVRADDPLAFGIERFRDARDTYRADLQRLLDQLPPDRRDALACAQAQLRRDQTKLQHAERNVTNTRAALEQASRRHWGRRDHTTIERAEAAVRAAEREAGLCRHAVAESRQRVAGERRAVQTWAAASAATADERARLEASVRAFDDALDLSQPDRTSSPQPNRPCELRRLLEGPSSTPGPVWQHALRSAERMSSVEQRPPTLDLGLEL